MSDILNAKIKQKGLLNKSDVSKFVKKTSATKSKFKAKQDKIVRLHAFDSGYFQCKIFLMMMMIIMMAFKTYFLSIKTFNI